ncbi:SPKAP protein, partial [Polypterus senegalus]
MAMKSKATASQTYSEESTPSYVHKRTIFSYAMCLVKKIITEVKQEFKSKEGDSILHGSSRQPLMQCQPVSTGKTDGIHTAMSFHKQPLKLFVDSLHKYCDPGLLDFATQLISVALQEAKEEVRASKSESRRFSSLHTAVPPLHHPDFLCKNGFHSSPNCTLLSKSEIKNCMASGTSQNKSSSISEVVFDHKSSGDYFEGSHFTPLEHEAGSACSSFPSELVQDFHPSPPPPTPKDDTEEGPTRCEAPNEFMEKLVQSLIGKYSESVASINARNREAMKNHSSGQVDSIELYADQLVKEQLKLVLCSGTAEATEGAHCHKTGCKHNFLSQTNRAVKVKSAAAPKMNHAPQSSSLSLPSTMSQGSEKKKDQLSEKKASSKDIMYHHKYFIKNFAAFADKWVEELIQSSFQILKTSLPFRQCPESAKVGGKAEPFRDCGPCKELQRETLKSNRNMEKRSSSTTTPTVVTKTVPECQTSPHHVCHTYGKMLTQNILREAFRAQMVATPCDNQNEVMQDLFTKVNDKAEKMSEQILQDAIVSLGKQESQKHSSEMEVQMLEGTDSSSLREKNDGGTQSVQTSLEGIGRCKLDSAIRQTQDCVKLLPKKLPGQCHSENGQSVIYQSSVFKAQEYRTDSSRMSIVPLSIMEDKEFTESDTNRSVKPVLIKMDVKHDIFTQELQVLLLWASASHLNIPAVYCILSTKESQKQISYVVKNVLKKSWTVSDLLKKVLSYCDLKKEASIKGQPLTVHLFEWMLHDTELQES